MTDLILTAVVIVLGAFSAYFAGQSRKLKEEKSFMEELHAERTEVLEAQAAVERNRRMKLEAEAAQLRIQNATHEAESRAKSRQTEVQRNAQSRRNDDAPVRFPDSLHEYTTLAVLGSAASDSSASSLHTASDSSTSSSFD